MTASASMSSLVDTNLSSRCRSFEYRFVKRLFDVICAFCGLVLVSPLALFIALAIILLSPGPLLYEWNVVGRGGRKFVGYKFRTMVVDADALKQQFLQHNERVGPTFKMKDDPRVTAVGGVLRKFSLDEIPQLWSVLKGDMSLVGPRPVSHSEWEAFEPWQRRKLSVTPGGICLWHVRGKPATFDESIRFDLEYIDNWSPWLDFKILIAGIWYVVSGKNY